MKAAVLLGALSAGVAACSAASPPSISHLEIQAPVTRSTEVRGNGFLLSGSVNVSDAAGECGLSLHVIIEDAAHRTSEWNTALTPGCDDPGPGFDRPAGFSFGLSPAFAPGAYTFIVSVVDSSSNASNALTQTVELD